MSLTHLKAFSYIYAGTAYDLEVAGAGAKQLSSIQMYTGLWPICLKQVKKVEQWQDE